MKNVERNFSFLLINTAKYLSSNIQTDAIIHTIQFLKNYTNLVFKYSHSYYYYLLDVYMRLTAVVSIFIIKSIAQLFFFILNKI